MENITFYHKLITLTNCSIVNNKIAKNRFDWDEKTIEKSKDDFKDVLVQNNNNLVIYSSDDKKDIFISTIHDYKNQGVNFDVELRTFNKTIIL